TETEDRTRDFNSFVDHSEVTAPDGGLTTHLFYSRGGGAWNTGLEYKTTAPEGTTWRCWQRNFPYIDVSSAPADANNPFVGLQYHQLPPLAANAAATSFDYDKNGNLITKREYDWTAAPTNNDVSAGNTFCSIGATVLRKTENQYWNQAGTHAADSGSAG